MLCKLLKEVILRFGDKLFKTMKIDVYQRCIMAILFNKNKSKIAEPIEINRGNHATRNNKQKIKPRNRKRSDRQLSYWLKSTRIDVEIIDENEIVEDGRLRFAFSQKRRETRRFVAANIGKKSE
ncbi:hypothetical protein SDJN03_09285, partial [Cucurbita argyrosperma subsp. sororia]